MKLKVESNLRAPNDIYQALMDMHRNLSDEQSHLVNGRLIPLLANHIGDTETLREAVMLMNRDLSDEQGQLANAKLILLLANHIGNSETLRELMRLAAGGIRIQPR